MKRGISLIVLIVTIIIIIILAGTIVLSLSNNNVISKSNQAAFRQTIEAYNSGLSMSIIRKYETDYNFTPSTFNATSWDGTEGNITGTVKEYIPSISAEDGSQYIIESGKLVYIGEDEQKIEWSKNIITSNPPEKLYVTSKSKISSTDRHRMPYIPEGFKYVEGTWDTGLVIEDTVGNQFVWVPVDGINVPYAKWATTGLVYTSTTDDTIPVTNEMSQITNYGGFYIARYEAGKESGILVSKKGATVWTSINYIDSKANAEAMYNTPFVKSGLVTGTQWDTTLEWINDSGKSVTDSRLWGNYRNSMGDAYIAGKSGTLQVAGYSEYWKSNNIYDIAGNAWEWSNEKYNGDVDRILRAGSKYDNGNINPATFRLNRETTHTGFGGPITFRVVLYIL